MTIGLVGFGIVMVYSSSSIIAYFKYDNTWEFASKQILFAILGFVAMLFAMNIPYTFYQRTYKWLGLGSLAFMVIVLFPGIGQVRNGARAWIEIGGFTVQPAEFAKLGLIIFLAAQIAKKGDKIRNFSHGLMPLLIMIAVFIGVIIAQNDFGTAAILMGTAVVVLFSGGANFKQLFLIFLSVLPFAAIYIYTGNHTWDRIIGFMDPWQDPSNTSYQLVQSLYAIAHGEITGVGLGQSIQKFHYLPYPQTDFIFAIIAEELGFIGAMIFLLTYMAMLWRALLISLKSKDVFAGLVGVGVVSGIALQALINLGGVTGSIPITGVPLPLISAGGSSLIVTMTGLGIILGISRQVNRQEREYEKKV